MGSPMDRAPTGTLLSSSPHESNNKPRRPTWADIPSEVVCKLLEKLPGPDKANARLVSRAWMGMVASAPLKLCIPAGEMPAEWARRFPGVHSVTLPELGRRYLEAYMADLRALPSLTSLEMHDAGDNELMLLATLSRLETLTLAKCRGVTAAGLVALRELRSLTAVELDLQLCRTLRAQGIREAAALPVTFLQLNGPDNGLDDGGFLRLCSEAPSLTGLSVSRLENVTLDGMVSLPDLRRLKRLRLSGCITLRNSGLEFVKHVTSIESLELQNCPLAGPGLSELGHLPSLRSLGLAHCSSLTDQELQKLARGGTTGLTCLDLSSCREISDAGLAAIAPSLGSLTDLNLCRAGPFTDASMVLIASSCPHLTALDIGLQPSITARGLRSLFGSGQQHVEEGEEGEDEEGEDGQQHVEVVEEGEEEGEEGEGEEGEEDEDGQQQEGEGQDESPEPPKLSSLTSLSLMAARGLATPELFGALGGLPSLRALDLRNCGYLGDAELAAVCAACTALESLRLSWCFRLSDPGASELGRLAPTLRSLDLTGCARITDAAFGAPAANAEGAQQGAGEAGEGTEAAAGGDAAEAAGGGAGGGGYSGGIGALTNLTSLQLTACTNLTDACLERIGGLTDMCDLSLFRLIHITDPGLQPLKALTRLRSINLLHCEHVTMEGINDLLHSLGRCISMDHMWL